jgi:peptidoglycan-N-acetylglucosamine deacetylase
MINLSPPKYFTKFFPHLTWSYPEEKNTVFLTFDDGPTPGVTPWVLEVLKQYNAKATFFCLGKNVKSHPDIYKQIIADGHAVGNHTNNHLRGWETDTTDYVQNVHKAEGFIDSKLFRPPYGRIKPSQVKLLSKEYKIVMWSLLSMDYSRWITPKRCSKIVLNNLHPGAIIVFHDSIKAEKNMKHALVLLLDEIKERGYNFGIIS